MACEKPAKAGLSKKEWGKAMNKYVCCKHPTLKFCGKKKDNKKKD